VPRKEFSKFPFFPLNALPKKTFNVPPYMKGLPPWFKVPGFGGGGKKSGGGRGNTSNQKQRTASTKKERNTSNKKERNTSNKKAREQDNEAFGNTAAAGTGWSEEEMIRANEVLNNQKISYSGNPHEFSNDGFDPHKFHVVGGSFMNGPGAEIGGGDGGNIVSTGAATGGKEVVDADGFVSFFGDDGVAPWERESGKEEETANESKEAGKEKKNKQKKQQQQKQQQPQLQDLTSAKEKKNMLTSMIGIGEHTYKDESSSDVSGNPVKVEKRGRTSPQIKGKVEKITKYRGTTN